MFPDYEHDIPNCTDINISKLGASEALTSNICNSARRTRRLLLNSITDASNNLGKRKGIILEVDCWNHLRNIWLGGLTKALSGYLRNILQNYLDHIDPRLRVTSGIDSVLRAVDK